MNTKGDYGTINIVKDFLSKFGKNPHGEDLFRLVWSSETLETRKGEFNEFYGSIFIRTLRGVMEVPKYPYLPPTWVMEKWFPGEICNNPDLPFSWKGSYEPIYVFADRLNNSLPLNLRVVEIVMDHYVRPRESSSLAKKSRINDELAMIDDKEVKYFEEMIDSSPMVTLIHIGGGVGYTKGLKDVTDFKRNR